MTTKHVKQRQEAFFKQCLDSNQSLDEILEDLEIPPETLAGWLMTRAFRVRMQGMRRYLRRARELQVQIGALRASAMLLRAATDTLVTPPQAISRAACVDLIRLARDSRARRAANDPHPDDVLKARTPIYHPDVDEAEARALIEELARDEHQPTGAARRGELPEPK